MITDLALPAGFSLAAAAALLADSNPGNPRPSSPEHPTWTNPRRVMRG
jgi:hypothetical protein